MGAGRREAAVVVASTMLVGSLGGALAVPPAAAVTTDQSYWVPVDKRLTIDGHGYGHGHGMSQHGAQGAALQGLTYKEIAKFYYPGTAWRQVRGKVRVLITADTTDDVVVSPASGLAVRDLGDGSTHALPTYSDITRWRLVVRSGRTVLQRYNDGWRLLRRKWNRNFSGDVEFFADAPMTLWTPSGSKRYRGTLRAASPSRGSSARDTVNVVSMDQYVMGVVPYEMPASWHPEAVKAQAVAARTYATWSRNQRRAGHYQICDTTSCQVYGGVSGEDSRSNAAVRATARQILSYGGSAAFTQFSASSGGWTSAGSVPYLPAQEDPYDAWQGNTVHDWSVDVDAAVLERKYPSIGTLERIRVTNREGNGEWRGRATTIVLDGSKADVTISGDTLRWTYGLRSTWFAIRPTPIIRRWQAIGGASSVVGAVQGAEYAVKTGSAQRFERGRIFRSSKTPARELYGRVLRKYRSIGGPKSKLGFPVSKVWHRGEDRLARFQGGSIYWDRPATPVVVTGAIDRRWIAEGGFRSGLGWATTSNYAVRVGERVDYVNGAIIWNKRRNTTRVIRY
ncbi:MAG TPA: SpoIID/LytB domain-containing protein [Nocardioidaceae bacterium]